MKTTVDISLYTLTFICLLLFGCDNFVTVDLPDSQLTVPAVFEDRVTANAAMVSVYAKLRDGGLLTGSPTGLSHQLGNYTDELTYYGNPQNSAQDFYNNVLLASHSDLRELWNSSYNQIYAANSIILGITPYSKLAALDRDRLKGEALFVRALVHFYLVNTYGDIPYITTTDYEQNKTVSRLSVMTVNNLIEKDLIAALALIPEPYIDATRVRPNKATVRALLARLYLYVGRYSEAINQASAVLSETGMYTMETNIDKEFLKGSRGTIWQLSPNAATENTQEGNTFLFSSGPPPLSSISESLLNAFEPGDLRRTHWIGSFTAGINTWFYPNKYKLGLYDSGVQEYSIMFRVAELYLIRSEARARQGELTTAREDLNVIRNRAGLGDTPALTQGDIIAAVLAERRLELFTELGHRFFDLKRTDVLNSVLSTIKPGWDANDRLLPLPESELLLNSNLMPQNRGY